MRSICGKSFLPRVFIIIGLILCGHRNAAAIKFGSEFGLTLQSITIYEGTTGIVPYTFLISDTRLQNDISEGPPNHFDFQGTNQEYYDIYIGDENGNLDYNNGEYLTIGCYHDANLFNTATGNNIDAVSLNFQGGTKRWAIRVGSFQLGDNLTDPSLSADGLVQHALGPNDGQLTYMGAHQSRMTLGFSFKTAVVLVHGWGSNESIWNTMESWLKQDGYVNVWKVNTLNPCGFPGEKRFDKNAQALSTFIQQKSIETGVPIDKIDIIAHSMGGLVSRRYISESSSWGAHGRVRTLITLGSPHLGVHLALLTKKNFWKLFGCKPCTPIINALIDFWKKCSGPAKEEMSSADMLLFNLLYKNDPQTKYARAVGEYYTCFYNIGGKRIFVPFSEGCPHDGIVGSASANGWPFFPLSNLAFAPLKHSQLPTSSPLYLGAIRQALGFYGTSYESNLPFAVASDSDTTTLEQDVDYSKIVTLHAFETMDDSFTVSTDSAFAVETFDFGGGMLTTLRTPSGAIIDSTTPLTDSNVTYSTDLGLTFFTITNPEPGTWKVVVTADSLPDTLWACLIAISKNDGVDMNTSVSSDTALIGDTIVVTASLISGSNPVTGASVSLTAIPDSVDTSWVYTMLDDGLGFDIQANDGVYTAPFAHFINLGTFLLDIEASGTYLSQGFHKEGQKEVLVSELSCIGIPGDANASANLTLSDIISTVNYIFNRPGFPSCPSNSNLCWLSDLLCRGDWNGDANVTLSDVIRGVNYIFNKPGGPWAPLPSGACCLPVP